jgi:hypothetical protein
MAFRFKKLTPLERNGHLRVTSSPQIEEINALNNSVDLADVRTAMLRAAEIEAAMQIRRE